MRQKVPKSHFSQIENILKSGTGFNEFNELKIFSKKVAHSRKINLVSAFDASIKKFWSNTGFEPRIHVLLVPTHCQFCTVPSAQILGQVIEFTEICQLIKREYYSLRFSRKRQKRTSHQKGLFLNKCNEGSTVCYLCRHKLKLWPTHFFSNIDSNLISSNCYNFDFQLL